MEERPRQAEQDSSDGSGSTVPEPLLKRIFQEANDAILLLDTRADKVLLANRRAGEWLGYAVEELMQAAASAIFPGEVDRLMDFVRSVPQEGTGWTGEMACFTRHGQCLPAEVSATVFQHQGKALVLAHLRDISVRKSTEERFHHAYDRLRTDMEAAARIQKSLLPRVSPVVAGMRFAWEIFPCGELAGDTLNIFHLDREHVGFFVLDVSGHGAPAAMMSMSIHRLLSAQKGPPSVLFCRDSAGQITGIASPEEVCRDLNTHFQMDHELPQYFTLLYGILDGRTGEVRFVTAGHCAPVYVPPDASPHELRGRNFPIGLFPDSCFTSQTVTLAPGSRFYIYSDGLTEAANSEGEQFGQRRLLAAIDETRDESLRGSLTSLLGAMRGWSLNGSLADDVSLLAFEVAPAELA